MDVMRDRKSLIQTINSGLLSPNSIIAESQFKGKRRRLDTSKSEHDETINESDIHGNDSNKELMFSNINNT